MAFRGGTSRSTADRTRERSSTQPTPTARSGAQSTRAEAISASFTRAGFKAPITSDIRGEIWLKIWGNLSFNPISALTHTTLVDLLQFPLTRQLCADMMREAEVI